MTLYLMLKCKAMAEATLSSKNQIVLPKEAREALQVKPGDKIAVVVSGDRVIVLRKATEPHKALLGMARGVYPEDYLKKERESWD
jgi:AbrB family looped-hinge helix DNA binding protein